MIFPFLLSLEVDGFGLVVGDEGVAIGVDLVCCLAKVVVEGDLSSLMERREVTSAMGSWVHSGESLKSSSRTDPSVV